jgi:hypothetical protein
MHLPVIILVNKFADSSSNGSGRLFANGINDDEDAD